MTDKRNIWHISLATLATLGTVGVCALTLLAGAQEAQAAPPAPGNEPIISTAQLRDGSLTEKLIGFPDINRIAIHIGDFFSPKPFEL